MKVSISFILLILISFFSDIWLSQSLFAQEIKEKVPAERILEMIEKGEPVEIDNAIITGALDLNKIKIEVKEINGKEMRVVESAIRITDSIIQEEVDFSFYVPGKPGELSTFFTEKVSFQDTQFDKKADFSIAQFNEEVDLMTAQFNGEASFWGSQFNEKVHFWKAQFNGEASFSLTQFNEEASFTYAQFNGKAGFVQTQFNKKVDFWDAQFNGETNFLDADFNGKADFASAEFNGKAAFVWTDFNGKADFTNADFTREADFTYVQFNDEISFANSYFQTMFIEWEQIEGKFEYNRLFYIRLTKNFKEMGQFEDADDAYYSYRVNKRRIKEKWHDYPMSLLEFIFLDLSCGYGVKPERTIIFGLVLIFLFSCFYYQTGAIKERANPGSKARFWDAFYFSVNTFTTVGYGDWYPTAECVRIKRRKICSFRTLAMVEGFMGWFMMALFLVTLAKVWIR